GIPLINRLEAEADRIAREARRSGSTESREAYAADALAKMLSGQGRGNGRRADVVIVCDLRAYRRGHGEEGETCHVMGGGPVPASAAREAAEDDAFIKAVVHDGTKIDTVVHYGRHISAELRTALDLGDAPGFEGVVCAEPGCGRRYGLEWDHVDPVANGGPTSFKNLKGRCWRCHREKTRRDRIAGLLGARGRDGPAGTEADEDQDWEWWEHGTDGNGVADLHANETLFPRGKEQTCSNP
ncbi:MAG TPA: HNH endonuclease signature motif containing protein, partial [Acidimicrobiales bacterium]|nr:HNH endonuclease signature motif containing protein [Acidimicrobiales bacterium]